MVIDALAVCDDDGARADEAYAGDDLRAETGNVRIEIELKVEELACKRGYRRAEADEDMRAEACRTALVRALDTDDAAADKCTGETHKHGKRRHVAQAVKNR